MQVTIRLLQEQDAYTSVKWRNDPEVFKYTGKTFKSEIKIENELEWIRKAIANNEAGKDYRCAIEVDGVYVGNIYLTDIENGSATYHIFIGNKSYWGKGVAKEASRQLIGYAFDVLKLNSLFLRVRLINERAFSLYKSMGFVEVERNEEWASM